METKYRNIWIYVEVFRNVLQYIENIRNLTATIIFAHFSIYFYPYYICIIFNMFPYFLYLKTKTIKKTIQL